MSPRVSRQVLHMSARQNGCIVVILSSASKKVKVTRKSSEHRVIRASVLILICV